MNYRSPFWRYQVYTLIMVGVALFILLTLIAMLFYPGGGIADKTSTSYSFFKNFFSELGFTITSAGYPNPISAVLFFISMTLAGTCLVLFFLAFPQFFIQTPSGKMLSIFGSIFGVISGLCFIGVAFTPANLFLEAHKSFVLWAFRLFPIAVFFYSVDIFRQKGYPKRYAYIFVAFGILLVLYILLMEKGPDIQSPEGVIIQATGQKIISYASLLSILSQAWKARKAAQWKTPHQTN